MEKPEKKAMAEEMAKAFFRLKRFPWEKDRWDMIKKNEFMLLVAVKSNIYPEARGIKVTELSNIMEITPAAITHTINSLEEKGYIERLSDKTDRRIVLVKITDSGKHIIELKEEEFFENIEDSIDFLGEKDSKELIRILTSLYMHYRERNDSNECR